MSCECDGCRHGRCRLRVLEAGVRAALEQVAAAQRAAQGGDRSGAAQLAWAARESLLKALEG